MIPDAFLRAIIERRDDDLPRLICADFLDEHGESERAEFIRLQCAGTRWPHKKRAGIARQVAGKLIEFLYYENSVGRQVKHFIVSGWKGKRWMLRALWNNEYLMYGGEPNYRQPGPRERIWIERGFVNEIAISWQDWLTHADAILKATPLERVRLTTMPQRTMRITNYPTDGVTGTGVITEASEQTKRWPGIEFEPHRNPIDTILSYRPSFVMDD